MSIYTKNILKAVITALKNDATVSGYLGDRVFTHVKQDSAFPYSAIRTISEPYDAKNLSGTETIIRIHVFSQYDGASEVLNITSAIHDVLHEASLAVDGANLVNLRYDGGGDALPEPDGKSWNGFVDFRSVCTN